MPNDRTFVFVSQFDRNSVNCQLPNEQNHEIIRTICLALGATMRSPRVLAILLALLALLLQQQAASSKQQAQSAERRASSQQ
jgi:hypothetical protein